MPVHGVADAPGSPAELEGFWAEASEALLLFPLTPPIRRSLLQLMHVAPAAEHDRVMHCCMRFRLNSDSHCPLPQCQAANEGACCAALQQPQSAVAFHIWHDVACCRHR